MWYTWKNKCRKYVFICSWTFTSFPQIREMAYLHVYFVFLQVVLVTLGIQIATSVSWPCFNMMTVFECIGVLNIHVLQSKTGQLLHRLISDLYDGNLYTQGRHAYIELVAMSPYTSRKPKQFRDVLAFCCLARNRNWWILMPHHRMLHTIFVPLYISVHAGLHSILNKLQPVEDMRF